MAITLRQLRVLTSIVHAGTLTAAAERLHLTKPAVSLALAELEKQCGRQLFDRYHNRLYLNDEGRRLLPLADELLSRSDELETLFERHDRLAGQLRLGASYTIGHQLLPWLLRDFRDATGHRDQRVSIANSSNVQSRVAAFELDLAMVEGDIYRPELTVLAWRRDRMLIAAGVDHPLAGQRLAGLSQLDGEEWILREPGSGTREQFMRQVAPQLARWRPGLELNSAEAIVNATAAGLGITCLSELEARHALDDGRLVEITLPLRLERRLRLVLHRDKYRSPLIRHFLAFCREWRRTN
ncbi:LysR substrate-binding domain-containing protein [Kushneria aurantia]|uniref:LysR substrate-binding domain-containing protein n=1 Tax=Kushneria aurantia TaxID=504092 RepID=A0ABV6G339_9GAMM|nr:LysR substrate-binding domain-containing protein [Kushneria aurantia]